MLPKLHKCLALLCLTQAAAASTDTLELEQRAQSLTHEYVGQLKPQLKAALQSGGPVAAIKVCSEQAPGIAAALSRDSGWSVRRVSLRARNTQLAQPDSWETEVLREFDRLRAAGASPQELRKHGTVNGHYRYMQGQVTEGVCLLCHGETISAPVAQALEQYYPDDTATGYQLGEVRGAISLQAPD